MKLACLFFVKNQFNLNKLTKNIALVIFFVSLFKFHLAFTKKEANFNWLV